MNTIYSRIVHLSTKKHNLIKVIKVIIPMEEASSIKKRKSPVRNVQLVVVQHEK